MLRSKLFFVCPSLLLGSLSAVAQNRSDAFGVDLYTVTTISAASFTPNSSDMFWTTSGSIGRTGALNTLAQFYVAVDLPAGAVIDYVGLNSNTDTVGSISVDLLHRTHLGDTTPIANAVAFDHSGLWDTDFNSTAASYTWTAQSGEALLLKVQIEPEPTSQYLGWVEIWWKRQVSPAPVKSSFNDVPTDHPFYQYIEALASSSITGGCGNGNYCPDAPVTRGQMAVFLSKALGLNWPGAILPPGSTHD